MQRRRQRRLHRRATPREQLAQARHERLVVLCELDGRRDVQLVCE
jgi:hypothetical protein